MIKLISASSIKLYEECPYCWKLRYIYRLLQPPVKAFLIGTAFHRGCELYHLKTPEKAIWQELKRDYLDGSDGSEERFEMIEKLVSFYLKNPLDIKTLHPEKMFSIKIKGVPVPLFGFIDGVVEGGIKEYKTTSTDYKQEDIDNIQTKIYSYAYYKLYGEIPLVTYYIINKKKVHQKKYKPQILTIKKDETVIQEVEQMVKEFYTKIKSNDFSPGSGFHWASVPGYCPTGFIPGKKKENVDK